METVRINTIVLPNGRVVLNDLPFEDGKQVEVIISDTNGKHTVSEDNPLRGGVLRYDDPFAPAVSVEDWEAIG